MITLSISFLAKKKRFALQDGHVVSFKRTTAGSNSDHKERLMAMLNLRRINSAAHTQGELSIPAKFLVGATRRLLNFLSPG